MNDIHVLTQWIRVVLIVAAIGTTSVPIMYSFTSWRTHTLGRLFMMKAISFAAAMDLSVLFSFWHPTSLKSIYVLFLIDVIILTAIAISTSLMAWFVWQMNHPKIRKKVTDATRKGVRRS
jgi:uncharacterized protein (DUF2062 family)